MVEKLASPIEGEWECGDCGYVKIGTAAEPPEKSCPECGAPANMFVFYSYEDDDED